MRTLGRFIRRLRQRRHLAHLRRRLGTGTGLGAGGGWAASEQKAAPAALAEQRMDAVTDRLDRIEQRLRDVTARAEDAHRLAVAGSRSIEQLLQAEVQLWQAVDAKRD